MANIAELSPAGRRLEARATMLNTWHRLLHVHDHLDLNDPESSAIAAVTTLLADKLEECEGERPRRRQPFTIHSDPRTATWTITCPPGGKEYGPYEGSEEAAIHCAREEGAKI